LREQSASGGRSGHNSDMTSNSGAACGASLRIRREMTLEELHWNAVKLHLIGHAAVSSAQADTALKSFIKRFTLPGNPYWHLRSSPDASDRAVLRAAALCHSADTICISHLRSFSTALCRFEHKQTLCYDLQSGSAEMHGSIAALGIILTLDTLPRTIAFDIALCCFAILTYVLLAGCLIYGTAVFVVFLGDPAAVTFAATKNGAIGAALLCYLMAGAVAVRHLVAASLRLGRRRKAARAR